MNRILIAVLIFPSLALAHDFGWTDVRFQVDGDQFRLEMIADLDPLALGNPAGSDNDTQAALLQALSPVAFDGKRADLVTLFQRRVRLRFDGQPVSFQVFFPEAGKAEDSVLGTLAVLSGEVPVGAETFSFFCSRTFPAVRLAIVGPDGPMGDPIALAGGQRSEAFPLNQLIKENTFSVARRYLVLGFYHILPAGPDHILFVLGLFLFCRRRWKPLIWQVTAFSLAHTVTLALAAQDLVSLPSKPVEVLIAISILYVAIENLLSDTLKPHRIAVVFLFGLLHGLGFAGVLGELGLPQSSFTTALLSFNLGVELAQLAVITIAFCLVGRWSGSDFYRARVVQPASIAIGLTAIYWIVERLA